MAKTWTREELFESLNCAIDNGYELDEWDALAIAVDITNYDVKFESVEPEELVPAIDEWKAERNKS